MNTTKDVIPQKLLKIEDLVLHFKTRAGVVQAVDGVDFELDTNRAVVILGESGCGKSSLAKAILRLLPRNVERYSGEVYLQGTDVMKFDEEQFRVSLGAEIARSFTLESGSTLTPQVGVTGGFSGLDGSGAFGNLAAELSLNTADFWTFDFGLLFNIEGEGEKSVGARARTSKNF